MDALMTPSGGKVEWSGGELELTGIEITDAGKRREYTLRNAGKASMVSQLIQKGGLIRSLPATALAVIALATSLLGQNSQPAGAAKRGEPFELKANEASRLADENLLVRFEGVTEDSRCPVRTQCVWAGDAAVELMLEKPPAASATRMLHTSERVGRDAELRGPGRSTRRSEATAP